MYFLQLFFRIIILKGLQVTKLIQHIIDSHTIDSSQKNAKQKLYLIITTGKRFVQSC